MQGNFGRRIVQRSLVALTTVVTMAVAGGGYTAAQFNQFQSAIGGANWDGGYQATVTTQDGGIIRTWEENTISVGETRSFGSDYDVYVAEVDPCGDMVQSFVYDLGGNDQGRKIRQMPNGDYIIVGVTGFDDNPQSRDAFLMRINRFGGVIWTRAYGIGGHNHDEGKDVRVDPVTGDIYACGFSRNSGAGSYDGWIWKVNPANGNIIWSKLYGDIFEDRLNALEFGCQGSILATGMTITYASSPNKNLWVVKVDPANGNLLWSFRHWGTGNTEGKGIAVNPNGREFYLVGYTENISATGMQEYMGAFNCSDGSLVQESVVGDDPGHAACLNDIQYDPAGGLLAVGTWRHDNTFRVHVMRLTSGAFPLLSRSYAGPGEKEYGYSMTPTVDWDGDGQYDLAMVGSAMSLGAGLGDMYVIGTDPYGISGCNQKKQSYLLYDPFLTTQKITSKVNDFDVSRDIIAIEQVANIFTRICSGCYPERFVPQEEGESLSQGLSPGSDAQGRIGVDPLSATTAEGAVTR